MKNIAILGSTGSVGCSTLKVARHLKDEICIKVLAARSNIDLLEEQARDFNPQLIVVYEEAQAQALRKRIQNIPILHGMEGLKAAATHPDINFVVSAMTGSIGMLPTFFAIEAGKQIGLANKEALVAGGALIMAVARKKGVNVLPIDSEHSAIFQCLVGQPRNAVRRLILTASGGPFREYSTDQLERVTPEQALCHPTWKMGAKITIDSSTLMNKGLEVIEAHWLYDMPIDEISVVIHPQSVVHSMVEFKDNSLLAQMGESQMIIPIQYALTYPERKPGLLPLFDITKHATLQFFAPDMKRFRCLQLAYDAIKCGGSMPAYMNAVNEVLVNKYLEKRIGWLDIAGKLEELMERHRIASLATIEDVLMIDSQARREANAIFR